jgi:hypothetical protein
MAVWGGTDGKLRTTILCCTCPLWVDGGEVSIIVGFGRNGNALVTPFDDFASAGKGNGDGSRH